jgi:predicted PP-loop superfamily ATPase
MSEVKLDPRDNKTRPCSRCEEVVSTTVKAYTREEREAEEEEFAHMSLDEYLSSKRRYPFD